ncbi:MAG: BamA/TamA family outer membrane protein [Candidatus Sulfotelmatobacter sp.]
MESKSQKDTAQEPAAPPAPEVKPQERTEKTATKNEEKKKEHRGSIVIAPLPLVSPAIGTGLVPIVGYIFPFSKNDKISPPSTIGGGGLITNNGTRAWFFGGQLFLKEDRYEVTAGYGRGNLEYNLYGIGLVAGNAGLKLPLNQTGHVFFGEVVRRIAWKFFVGPRFIDGGSFLTINPNDGKIPPLPPDVGINTTLTSLGFRVVRDTRPNHFYPTGGSKLEFTGDFFSQALGSKYSFAHYKFNYDKYWGVSKSQVLAYDLYVCDTGGQPPFYGNCIYGASNELRGYVAGQYIDRHMYATQVEYRLSLPWRLGLAAFTGVGEVVPGATEYLRSSHLLPDIGGGPRFVLSSKYHVNLRTDFARGKDSWTWSMGVGEAF